MNNHQFDLGYDSGDVLKLLKYEIRKYINSFNMGTNNKNQPLQIEITTIINNIVEKWPCGAIKYLIITKVRILR